MSIRAVFLGNDHWSVPALQALARADDIGTELVVTNPAKPAGRGSKITPTAVASAAASLGLPTFETARVGSQEGLRRLLTASPDVLIVVAYGELLSAEVLGLAPLGAVNLHFSLLPRWRGASPVQAAIMAGDPTTGVTAMLIDQGMDTGPILLAREMSIEPSEDAGTLGGRLAEAGAPLLVEAVRSLAAGMATPVAQDESKATAAPKLSKTDRIIDWGREAEFVVRLVRALSPEPGAETSLTGRALKVFTAEVCEPDRFPAGDPGVVLEVGRESVVIAAARSAVRLMDIAEAGRKRMSAGAWARGSRLSAGERVE
jgi:methionyl-tRNA formyltransferase